jgi:exonuclease 3'-5' domain-containing protein 1
MTSLETIMGKLGLSEPGEQSIRKPTPAVMVDTSDTLKSLVDTLIPLEKSFGSIYMDLEGVRLSRHGSISIIQILVPSCEQAFIVDVHTLGQTAFDNLGSEGKSLKDALESETIKKYLFDVRNDSDALFALFGVRLAGVVDVQLLELASRKGPKHFVCGLAKCIEQEQTLPSLALSQWQSTKKEGVKMFDPKLGGSYEVFNVRPLPQVLIEYCVGDVEFLPLLSAIYDSRLDGPGMEKVRIETEKRLEQSRRPSYEPHGRHKSLAPQRWMHPHRDGKNKSTATEAASAPKKEKNRPVMVAAPVPNEQKNPAAAAATSASKNGVQPVTANIAASAPKKGRKPTARVAAPASKKGNNPYARAVASVPNKGGKPTAKVAAPGPKKGEKSAATVPAPASRKGNDPTATAVASVPKKGEKSTARGAAPMPRNRKNPTERITAPVPQKGEKPAALVAVLALKKDESSTTKPAAPASKKGKKPTAAVAPSAPEKREKSTAIVAASASKTRKKSTTTAGGSAPKKEEKPIATVTTSTLKEEKNKTAIAAVSATCVPAPLGSQMVLTQPAVCKVLVSA